MNDKEAAIKFAQALIDNENSQRCDFCDTGYCRGNHDVSCVIVLAGLYLASVYEDGV